MKGLTVIGWLLPVFLIKSYWLKVGDTSDNDGPILIKSYWLK